MKTETVESIQAYRPDIDGLRAFAVLSVIGFHYFGIRGGFTGVDVFFVISGYLITRILLRELNSGNFSLTEFYLRRILRIVPALLLVLSFSLVLGWFSLLSDEYQALGKHLASGASFSSNITLWLESGYFDGASELKPLLHLWSLGIEEQFYIVFPLLLAWLYKRGSVTLQIFCILIIFSFATNIYFSGTNSALAFYLIPTRAWQLFFGAALASFELQRGASFLVLSTKNIRHVSSICGVVILIWSLIYINPNIVYPGYWATFPVVGATLLISAGPQGLINKYLFANRYMVAIGLISYPLYLWHWPLLSFSRIMSNGELSKTIKIIALGLSFILAFLTFSILEKRIRHSASKKIGYCLVAGLLVIAFLGGLIYKFRGFSFRYPLEEYSYALLKDVKGQKLLDDFSHPCSKKFIALDYYGECKQADAQLPANVLIVGDSHAMSYYPGLAYQYRQNKQNIMLAARGACVPLIGIETHRNGQPDVCQKIMAEIYDYALSQPSIETIIVAFRGPWYLHGGGSNYDKKDANPILLNGLNFDDAVLATYKKVSEGHKKMVIIVDHPELNFLPQSCLNVRPIRIGGAVRESCTVSEAWAKEISSDYRGRLIRLKKDMPKLTILDTFPYFCEKDSCFAILGEKVLYKDDNHLSVDGSMFLAEKFFQAQLLGLRKRR